MSNIIYVDNAATTPVSKPVFDAMAPYFCEAIRQPVQHLYSVGAAAGDALDAAREKVAARAGLRYRRGIFHELRLRGRQLGRQGHGAQIGNAGQKAPDHKLHRASRHPALAWPALEREGFEVTYLPVDAEGLVSPARCGAAIRPGHRACIHHVCQQRDRHHRAHRGDRRSMPQARRVVPHRRGAGCGCGAH